MANKSFSRILLFITFVFTMFALISYFKMESIRYDWQNRCGNTCAHTLGRRMQWINDADGCAELRAMYTSRPDSWSEREMKRWYEAVQDRADSMQCDLTKK